METLYVATDADIRRMIAETFNGHGGGKKLATKLRISEGTASVLRHGGGSLTKAARHFGYVPVPEQPGMWRQSTKKVAPETVGYRKWTPAVRLDVRMGIQTGERARDIAKRLGVTLRRLREVIKEHRLREPEAALSYHEMIALAREAGDKDLMRRIRVEKVARDAGGSLSDQTAIMQAALMSDDERRSFDADLKRLIDAAA